MSNPFSDPAELKSPDLKNKCSPFGGNDTSIALLRKGYSYPVRTGSNRIDATLFFKF
jgi:hypothetical protein